MDGFSVSDGKYNRVCCPSTSTDTITLENGEIKCLHPLTKDLSFNFNFDKVYKFSIVRSSETYTYYIKYNNENNNFDALRLNYNRWRPNVRDNITIDIYIDLDNTEYYENTSEFFRSIILQETDEDCTVIVNQNISKYKGDFPNCVRCADRAVKPLDNETYICVKPYIQANDGTNKCHKITYNSTVFSTVFMYVKHDKNNTYTRLASYTSSSYTSFSQSSIKIFMTEDQNPTYYYTTDPENENVYGPITIAVNILTPECSGINTTLDLVGTFPNCIDCLTDSTNDDRCTKICPNEDSDYWTGSSVGYSAVGTFTYDSDVSECQVECADGYTSIDLESTNQEGYYLNGGRIYNKACCETPTEPNTLAYYDNSCKTACNEGYTKDLDDNICKKECPTNDKYYMGEKDNYTFVTGKNKYIHDETECKVKCASDDAIDFQKAYDGVLKRNHWDPTVTYYHRFCCPPPPSNRSDVELDKSGGIHDKCRIQCKNDKDKKAEWNGTTYDNLICGWTECPNTDYGQGQYTVVSYRNSTKTINNIINESNQNPEITHIVRNREHWLLCRTGGFVEAPKSWCTLWIKNESGENVSWSVYNDYFITGGAFWDGAPITENNASSGGAWVLMSDYTLDYVKNTIIGDIALHISQVGDGTGNADRYYFRVNDSYNKLKSKASDPYQSGDSRIVYSYVKSTSSIEYWDTIVYLE